MLTLKNISKNFNTAGNEVCVLKNIIMNIDVGEYVSIVGKSGSGKSTLLNIIGTLLKPTQGEIILDGIDLSKSDEKSIAKIRNQKIGFVFQKFNLEPNFTVFQNVELPLIISGARNNRQKVAEILATLDLSEKIDTKAKLLSGGEQQRVAIARAIINNPDIILADEPCGNLDTENGNIVMSILEKLHNDGKTVILVTHDEIDSKRAERIITLSNGEIVKDEKNIQTDIQ